MFCDVFSGLAICALKGTKTEIAGKGDFIQVIIAENWWVPSVYIYTKTCHLYAEGELQKDSKCIVAFTCLKA